MPTLAAMLGAAAILVAALVVVQRQQERRVQVSDSINLHAGLLSPPPRKVAKKSTKRKTRPPSQTMLWLETLQQRAGDDTSPASVLLGAALAGAALGLTIWGATGQIPLGVGGMALGLYLPVIMLQSKAAKRMQVIDEQVLNACTLLAQNMQSGATVDQAFRQVAADFKAPLGTELRRVIQDVSIGAPLDVALGRMPGRLPGAPSLRLLVASLQIALEMGANLADQLTRISEVLRQRRLTIARISSTLAMVKIQGKILFTLPLLAYIWVHLQAPQLMTQWQAPGGEVKLMFLAAWVVTGYIVTQGILRRSFEGVI